MYVCMCMCEWCDIIIIKEELVMNLKENRETQEGLEEGSERWK